MKILIVGGGVAGLSLAGFLNKYKIGEITLIEKTPKFQTIGYLIGLWGNGRLMLKKLGIDEAVAGNYGCEIFWDEFENARDKPLKLLSLAGFRKFGPSVTITRSALQNGLISTIGNTEVKFGVTIKSIKQNLDSVEVSFSNQTQATFDLLVGADGAHSSVRERIFGNYLVKYYGWGVWVYWLPKTFEDKNKVVIRAGNGKLYALFPARDLPIVLFMATVPPGTGKPIEQRASQLEKKFKNFDSQINNILQIMPPPEQIFYDDLIRVDVPTWFKDRVVLIGDAQHATSPISGMGSSMAMEDAYALADELVKNPKDIRAALQSFAERRQNRIVKFRKAANRLDNWIMAGGLTGKLRDLLIPFVPSSYFLKSIEKLLETEI